MELLNTDTQSDANISENSTVDVAKNQPLLTPEQISLQVKCEIGNLNIQLDELLQLKIGSVVDIVKWPHAVKLTANGIYFAQGMLVELEGMLAVKITSKYTIGQ